MNRVCEYHTAKNFFSVNFPPCENFWLSDTYQSKNIFGSGKRCLSHVNPVQPIRWPAWMWQLIAISYSTHVSLSIQVPDHVHFDYRMWCASPYQLPGHPEGCCVLYIHAPLPNSQPFKYVYMYIWKHCTYHLSNVIVRPVSGIEDTKSIPRWKGNLTTHKAVVTQGTLVVYMQLFQLNHTAS